MLVGLECMVNMVKIEDFLFGYLFNDVMLLFCKYFDCCVVKFGLICV